MDNIEKLQLLPASNDLSADVRTILTEARRSTARAINTTMTTAYWLIGKRIVIEEQKGAERAAYGEGLLKKLSKELTADFGNGFSYENLKKMRQFYKTYTDEKGYTLCIQLPWSHNRLNSVLSESRQIFASKYLPYLPTEEELKRELENNNYVKRVEE